MRFITSLILVSISALILSQIPSPRVAGQERPRKVAPSTTPSPSSEKPKPAEQTGEEVDEGDVVRVETQLVSVPAVVTNRAGRPIPNLKADNFVLYENGNKQQIVNFGTTEAPFEIALLLDTSGSTRSDVALIRRAANVFINALRKGDQVSLVAFRTAKEEETSLATVDVLSPLTSDREQLQMALDNVLTSNGTPFYDSLDLIADEVFRKPPSEEARGRRAIVALTDGVDSASQTEFEESRDKLNRLGIACYFIQINTEDYVENRLMGDCQYRGTIRLSRTQLQRYRRIFDAKGDAADYANFCQLGPFQRMQISRNLYNLARKEMSELAKTSGGKTFEAADLNDARRAFAQVAQEIGTQYSLGYYPSNTARDGRFRQIKVEVKGVEPGTQVRAREGYVAPKG